MTSALEIIEQQTLQLDELSGLLNLELDAFKNRQPDNILAIAKQKVALLSKISSTDETLAQLPELAELKQQADFKDAIAVCDEKLANLKAQNAVNERVIQTSLNNITQLKQSLLSLKNADAMTYNRKGKAMTQTLGKGIKA